MVFPLRSPIEIWANCLIVFSEWVLFSPVIDPDVSRRKPAMILWGECLAASAATGSNGDAMTSNFPNSLPFSVRRSINWITLSGMKL